MDGDRKINSEEIITSSSSYYNKRLSLAASNDQNLIKNEDWVLITDDDPDDDGKSVIFTEGFETDLFEWRTKTTTPSSYYILQRTTAKAHSEYYSVEVLQTEDKGDTALYKTFATQKNGTVIFWFYDDTAVKGTQVVGIKNGKKDLK